MPIDQTPEDPDRPSAVAVIGNNADESGQMQRLEPQSRVVDFAKPNPAGRPRRSLARTFDETLDAARAGDDIAFESLYASLAPRIRSYARSRGAPFPDDLVNDVLLKIFTRLRQFQGNEAQFNAWVFTTVRNTLIDQARKRAVRPVEDLVDISPTTESLDNTETAAIGNVQLEALLNHLDVLTADQREVILLRVLADLSIDAVAQILQKSPGATKALQRRAFGAIARSLRGGSVTKLVTNVS